MMEIWKSVKEFEEFYEVSSLGRVRSKDRVMFRKCDTKPFTKKGRMRKLVPNCRTGYLTIVLSNGITKRTKYVHRLVAEVFVERQSGLDVVNHKNEIKTDNRAENLEWCTKEYNNTYNGKTQKPCKMIIQRNLTTFEETVWASARIASAATGINYKNISACCKGKRPSAGGCEWRFV